MIAYHTVIAQERRTPPRELATLIDGDQLHSLGYALNNPDDPNLIYIAAWNGVDPYITVLKGDNGSLKMRYAGWSTFTQAEYEAMQEALSALPETQPVQQGVTWPDWSTSWSP